MTLSMRGRQRKGRNFEREIVQKLWKAVGLEPPWRKGTRPDAGYRIPSEFGWAHMEYKRQERLNIWSALEQAEEEGKNHVPIVIFARNHSATYVAMRFEDWTSLVRSATK
jgi:hypothetical protein